MAPLPVGTGPTTADAGWFGLPPGLWVFGGQDWAICLAHREDNICRYDLIGVGVTFLEEVGYCGGRL